MGGIPIPPIPGGAYPPIPGAPPIPGIGGAGKARGSNWAYMFCNRKHISSIKATVWLLNKKDENAEREGETVNMVAKTYNWENIWLAK